MKWFKHDSDAHNDMKLQKLIIRYGLKGYGLYFYCLEQIAKNIETNNLTFELEDDAEVIAWRLKMHQEEVQEMMVYMIDLGLFENNQGVITCYKLAQRLDQSMTSSPEIKKLIRDRRSNDGKLHGYVYFIQGVSGSDRRIKIGHSINPWARLNDLKSHESYGNYDLSIVATMKVDDRYEIEKILHDHFCDDRIELEWFSPTTQLLTLVTKISDGEIFNYDQLLRHVVVSPEENRIEENRIDKATRVKTPDGVPTAKVTPYQKIVSLYHEILPMCPRVVKLTEARKANIRQRWKNDLVDLEDWTHYFSDAAKSKFLTGKVPPNGNRSKPFLADIDFLIKQSTVVKMQEGKYRG